MEEQLKQKMNEEIAKLPKNNQEAINSLDWYKIVEEVGQKHYLIESEIFDLKTETGLVLIGLVEGLNLYTLNIENNIGTSYEEAIKITEDIFDKIFAPVARMIEISVKNKMKTQSSKWNQSVNFIISGGDYSSFVDN